VVQRAPLFLRFDHHAEEAANFCVVILTNSWIMGVTDTETESWSCWHRELARRCHSLFRVLSSSRGSPVLSTPLRRRS
jgi:predicted 3-demethylubiquinone-9 3-methyltransferase (glyoxalase superfamily)